MSDPTREEALAHFGIKGQKWGVRNVKTSTASAFKSITPGQKQAAIALTITGASVAATILLSPIAGISVSAIGRAAAQAFPPTTDRYGPGLVKKP